MAELEAEIKDILKRTNHRTCPCCRYRFDKPLQVTDVDLSDILKTNKKVKLSMIDKYHRMTRDHLEIEKFQYKVPIEFQVKYLKDLGLAEFPGEPKVGQEVVPGSKLTLQNQNMKNEMRVAYLSEELDKL